MAARGGTITVHVGPNDSTVEISTGVSGEKISYPVTPGKVATIPVPNLPAGTAIVVSVGNGLRSKGTLVEIVEPRQR